MSNLPPTQYNNIPVPPQMNPNSGPPVSMLNQQYGNVPPSQLPPGYSSLKQDANSNSPAHLPTAVPHSGVPHNMNNYNQSASSSPAFNQPGMMSQQQLGLQSSPLRTPIKPSIVPVNSNPLPAFPPNTTMSTSNANNPSPYPPNYNQQQRQVNENAPPLIPSSQYQPLLNGPPGPVLPPASSQYPVSSTAFSAPPTMKPPNSSASYAGSINAPFNQGPPINASVTSQLGQLTSQPNMAFSVAPRNSPLLQGPTSSGPVFNGPALGLSQSASVPPGLSRPGINGPSNSLAGPLPLATQPSTFGPPSISGPSSMSGPSPIPGPLPKLGPSSMSGPPPLSGPPMAGPSLMTGPTTSGMMPPRPAAPVNSLPMMPPASSAPKQSQTYLGPPRNGQPMNPISANNLTSPQSLPIGFPVPQTNQMGATQGPLSGPLGGPPKTNIQNRYPPMPQGNYVNNQQPMTQQPMMSKQYPQHSAQALTQQMGQLSVTKQGFDQLWGHQMVDLMQCRHILPEYPEDPPEIRLGHQFADAPNCSPEIFRCTINRIPENNSLLQKSRLPLGILIHPFKDLNHLPVIQCTTIVRCRTCRTYINPFVYFVDSKRWKCNLCYRVNDLPEEFQYDPVSKSYGDPSRRPEIKSATIEFIAPGEYMLRPPQPAVYLFLLDVSQLARETGYLQVVCDTLKNSLDQLPGDSRMQIGFICYDAHVHYYLMSDGLTRPKEMTVLDIDDIFLPSPESLLVNLGERRELVKELLTVLPARYSTPGVPSSALGAALQAAYKLMAPTGGRITVFQTCLPNIGPGALQPREDPNARSSKDVAHLNPATDFYKRLALDCSGAQVAVDLFLLNSQYSDLATLSGMSKFSAGSVHHIPLFKASRSHQAAQLQRMLSRYLTRKIGFEAVMRVRCTRGIAIHTFHGNFFVRSTDLLSLPNVSPDAGFGMQLTIEESLSDLQQVCFQAALLYTSSKGERRIRVHTLALPIASTLTDVLHSADQQCIVGLLAKMAADRCVSASMPEAREALTNVAVDVLSAHRLSQNLPAGAQTAALHAPVNLRLLPLYLLALLKRRAFRTGTSTRLDDRVADMCDMKSLPLYQLMRAVYPELYPIHDLQEHTRPDEDPAPDPPRLQLSAERINSTGAYLLDDGDTMIIYVCHAVSPAFLSDTFGVAAFSQLTDDARTIPRLSSPGNARLHALIERLNDDRPYASSVILIKDNSPSRTLFTERLIEDRVESAFSYYEFLQHVKSQVK
ncbi:unnamed protein product [Chilo suppressalis]|uniref:Protein transport protein Sec24A n=1 Tax=Chilo suppressalis TaxID=168631 RepID=A0ABN8BJG9_CHISP|nr:unnamed protein product [Chilo suppressalis]